MKKYTLYILILVVLVGFFGFTFKTQAQSDNGNYTTTVPTSPNSSGTLNTTQSITVNGTLPTIDTQSPTLDTTIPSVPVSVPLLPLTGTSPTTTSALSANGTVSATPSASTSTSTTSSGGLVPCSTNCGFAQLLTLVNNIIYFILYGMVIPIAAILFAFAGFELVTSGGSTEKRGIAKKVFTNVVIGLVIAMACWLIVELLIHILGYKGAWIGF